MKRMSLTLFFTILALLGGISTEIHASDKVTVVLDWFVNPDHGPIAGTGCCISSSFQPE